MRRLRVLVRGLPRDSLFIGAIAPGADWTTTHELLASLIETNDAIALRHLKAQGAKRVPKPIRIPRPHAPKPKRRKATTEDLRRMFGGSIRYVGSSS